MDQNKLNVKLKILMLGSSGVGKSSLLLSFTSKQFCENMQNTIAVDYKDKQVILKGKTISLGIWDTAGQERFRTLSHTYYRGAHGVILVYDVTNRKTFMNLEAWLEELHTYCSSADIVKMVVGNKIDLKNREVSLTDGLLFARKHKTLYLECSATIPDVVETCFMDLVEKIIDNADLWTKYSRNNSDNNDFLYSTYDSRKVIHLENKSEPDSQSYCSCSSI